MVLLNSIVDIIKKVLHPYIYARAIKEETFPIMSDQREIPKEGEYIELPTAATLPHIEKLGNLFICHFKILRKLVKCKQLNTRCYFTILVIKHFIIV